MAWQSEVAPHWLHCVSLTRLGCTAKVLSQPDSEVAVLPLAADVDVCGSQPGTGPGVLAAVHQVHPGGATGDVLADLGHCTSDWAGVGGSVGGAPILAQGCQ